MQRLPLYRVVVFVPSAALDAVMLSQEKICGVSSMLKKIIPVTWEVIYNEKEKG